MTRYLVVVVALLIVPVLLTLSACGHNSEGARSPVAPDQTGNAAALAKRTPDAPDASSSPVAPATAETTNPPPRDNALPLTAVLEHASQTNKPVFLVFHAVWCAPCVKLEKEALVDPRVVRALDGYVSQSYDMELGEGVHAANRFGIRQVPAIVILSPKGEEVERISEQSAGAIAEELGAIHDVAARVPIDPSTIAKEKDARALLLSAKIYERTSQPETAILAYGAAVTALKRGRYEAYLVAEASFAFLRLETRSLDEKSHSRALLAFASAYPASAEAISALSTVAALPKTSYPDISRLRSVATALIAAQKHAKNGYPLRWLAASLQTLGDAEDAASASALANSLGAHEEAPLPPPPPDPLAAECPLCQRA